MRITGELRGLTSMFIKNGWYIAATSSDVTTAPVQKLICDEPIALYRTETGQVGALADRCIHRRMPLSKGRVIGDRLQCGYHGFEYDCAGKCVLVPG